MPLVDIEVLSVETLAYFLLARQNFIKLSFSLRLKQYFLVYLQFFFKTVHVSYCMLLLSLLCSLMFDEVLTYIVNNCLLIQRQRATTSANPYAHQHKGINQIPIQKFFDIKGPPSTDKVDYFKLYAISSSKFFKNSLLYECIYTFGVLQNFIHDY